MNYLIIGSGLTGSVIARHLANNGHRVEIWERRQHIAGNMYDYKDKNGIMVHKYGPHVFHTYKKDLYDYMMDKTSWVNFHITCKVYMNNKYTPSPFNFQTIDDYYSIKDAQELKNEILNEYPDTDKKTIVELLKSKNKIINDYAKFLYDNDYSLYTAKQWGILPSEIDLSVLKRVPVLFSYKDGYFDDPYQMIPRNGYFEIFKKLLAHENIVVNLGVDALNYLKIKGNKIFINGSEITSKIIYTGAIDELLECKYGPLPYRSLDFKWVTKNIDKFQEAPLVAYPAAKGFTRITEYKQFPQKAPKGITTLAYEYPLQYSLENHTEAYYPILTNESKDLYSKYLSEVSKIKNLFVCGRLGDFKYYNMDQALERALNICKQLD